MKLAYEHFFPVSALSFSQKHIKSILVCFQKDLKWLVCGNHLLLQSITCSRVAPVFVLVGFEVKVQEVYI